MFGDTKQRLARIERTLDHIINIIPYDEYTAVDILTEMAKALNGGAIPEHDTITITTGDDEPVYCGTRYTASGIGEALAEGLARAVEPSDLICDECATLPDEARDILLAQLERLDALAETLANDDDTMPLGGMASITTSMCAIARGLRG